MGKGRFYLETAFPCYAQTVKLILEKNAGQSFAEKLNITFPTPPPHRDTEFTTDL
jgi:hypothetical protein